jgi:hypothetical protein
MYPMHEGQPVFPRMPVNNGNERGDPLTTLLTILLMFVMVYGFWALVIWGMARLFGY